MNTYQKIQKLWMWSVLCACCVVSAGPASAEEPYRFVMAVGPWNLAQGRITMEDQPADPYFQYIENTLGVAPVTISWEWEGAKGYLQGLRRYLASGEPLDALWPMDVNMAAELIKNDVLIPLDDLLARHAPDILKAMTEQEWNLIRAQAPDKKIYYLPAFPVRSSIRTGFIRADWLERVGLAAPTTRDELVTVYKAFRDQDANGNGDPNDEIPVSGREGLRWCDDLFTMHGVSMYEGHPRLSWDAQTQQMMSHQVSDEMKQAIEFLRYLVEENLMDPVMPVQKQQDWTAKINADRVGHYFHLISLIDQFSAFREHQPEADWTYLPLVRVEGVPPPQHVWPKVAFSFPAFAITKHARDPAKIMQWHNWSIATKEGTMYEMLGIPGVDWTMKGDALEVINPNVPYYKYTNGFAATNALILSNDVLRLSKLGDTKVRILEQALKVGTTGYGDLGMPAGIYAGYEDFMPEKATLYRDYCAKMVLGVLPMTAWDEYVQKWHAQGGGEVLKRATAWYKEMNQIQ